MFLFLIEAEIYFRNLVIKLLNIGLKINKFLVFHDVILRFLNKIEVNLICDKHFLSYVNKKKMGLELNKDKVFYLSLRGSITDYAFHTDYFPGLYNLGLTSSGLYCSYHLYKNYANKLKNLKKVILTVGVFVPGYNLAYTKERYRLVSYNYFFEIPLVNEKAIKKRFVKYIRNKCSTLKNSEINLDYMGYEKKYSFFKNQDMTARAKSHLKANKREPDEMIWLEKLYQDIKKDNRELIIVIPPFRNDYSSALTHKNDVFYKFFQLDKGIKIIDMFDLNLFDYQDFGDGDHLNENGAIKFTEFVFKELHK